MRQKRGIYTIVCDGYEDGPAKAHADKAYLEDVRHTDAIAEICKKEQADGIIASFSDLLAECMIDIADAAGLPLLPQAQRGKVPAGETAHEADVPRTRHRVALATRRFALIR